MNKFNISQANPLKFYHQADVFNTIAVVDYKTFNPNYNTRDFDEDFYYRNVPKYLESRKYFQPFQQGDFNRLQWTGTDLLLGTLEPYNINILNCKGEVIKTKQCDFLYTYGILYNGDYLWETELDLFDVPEGKYIVQIHCATLPPEYDVYLISEPIEIKQKHEGTKLFHYLNSVNAHDIYYETGINFHFRIGCEFTELITNSKFNVYDDEPMNLELLGGVKYREWTLDFKNIPLWVVDKLELLFLHDSLKIDNKFYTRIEGSKIESVQNQFNSLCSAKIKVREKFNETSLVVTDMQTRKMVINGVDAKINTDLAFYVESYTLDTTTIAIEKYFLNKQDFLNYLNSNLASNFYTGNASKTFFSINGNNELCFTTDLIGIWTDAEIFTINNLIDTYIELDIDTSIYDYFECEFGLNASVDYAMFYNDGTAPLIGNTTAVTISFTHNFALPKQTAFIFINYMDYLNFTNNLTTVESFGGNLYKDLTAVNIANGVGLKYFKNNFLKSVLSFSFFDVTNNNLSTNEVIKLFLYLWEINGLDNSGNLNTNNQNPLAPLGSDTGVETFKNKLINFGWSITTD